MAGREPIAFISYVRSDDEHDSGRITELRSRLEGEVKMQTGRPFHIFQDRNDITWGQQWKERIEDALFDVTFLIPIITPSYFQSYACKMEFETFLVRERTLGEDRLILPVYYVTSDEMEEPGSTNAIAKVLKTRNWVDWRSLRFEDLSSSKARAEIAALAKAIKLTMKELEAVFAASKIGTTPPAIVPIAAKPANLSLTSYSPEVKSIVDKKFDKGRYKEVSKQAYYAYTKAFDEVIKPSRISQPAETMKLHSFLLAHIRENAAKSEKEIADFTKSLFEAGSQGSLALTVLIDNSGSMRGQKLVGTACWTSILSGALAQANIPFEVLGFTTRAWKGGQSREQWIQDGKPERPGRLNELRHIIYKDFDETFQEADTNFGIMLKDGLLKENIDGEALLWAYSRLSKQAAQRKLLFMISDGAPVDDSTLSENKSDFLDSHLVSTVGWIHAGQKVELYGIGVEYDVSRYYGLSPTLNESIGVDLLRVVNFAIGRRWKEAQGIQRESLPELPSSRTRKTSAKRRAV